MREYLRLVYAIKHKICAYIHLAIIIATAASVGLLQSGSAYAQSNVRAPKNLKGTFLPAAVTNRSTDGVLLEWQWEGDITRPGWFTVFRSIQDDVHFEPIGVSKDLRYLDDDLRHRNMVYYYYVTRVNENGDESEPSNVVKVWIPKKELVRIVSTPAKRAFIGVEYRYQVQVVSSDPGLSLKYGLEPVQGYPYPDGMTIDARNGMIQWIPRVQGRYQAMVFVSASNSARDTQILDICVTKTPGFGTLTGVIRDENGIVFPDVVVTAFLVGYTSTTGVDCSGRMIHDRNPVARTERDGRFRFDRLEAGSYLLVAKSPKRPYSVTWWKNATSARNADIIRVTPGDIVEADFILRKTFDTKMVKVCGFVTNRKGVPLPKTQVRAILLLPAGTPSVIEPVLTDESGEYCLTVPAETRFILSAWSEGYRLVFFRDAKSFMNATILNLRADKVNLNFQLDALPKRGRPIIGRVFNRFGVGVQALIQVLQLNSGRISVEQSIPTGVDGSYSGIIETDQPVSLLAVPVSVEKYAPAYYSGTPLVAMKWCDSKLLPGQTEMLRADIVVPEIRHDGAGMITGNVLTQEGKPIFAASVIARDDEGVVVAHAFSMEDGSYVLKGVTEGDIEIFADFPAYSCRTPHTIRVAYKDQRAVDKMNLVLTQQVATGISREHTVPLTTELAQNYPNPFSSVTQLRVLVSANERIALRVVDMYGRTVATLIDDVLAPGAYTVSFRAGRLSRGVYTAVLTTPQGVFTKSMLLMK